MKLPNEKEKQLGIYLIHGVKWEDNFRGNKKLAHLIDINVC